MPPWFKSSIDAVEKPLSAVGTHISRFRLGARLQVRQTGRDGREKDLAADGVKEWVEESVGDDVLLASALDSLGDLTIEERPYLGKFTVERIYEILTNAEATYWRRIYSGPGVRTNPGR